MNNLIPPEQLNRLLEYSPAAIAILEQNGRVLNITTSFTRIFGYTINDIPHIDAWWPLAYPDPHYCENRRAAWNEEVAAALAANTPLRNFEGHVTCKDGSKVWVEAHASFSASELIIMLVDISKRKEAEAEALRAQAESEQEKKTSAWLKLAMSCAHAGTWEWDLANNNNLWSEEIWQLYGLKEHEGLSSYRTWAETIYPEDRAATEAIVMNAAAAGREFEIKYRVRLQNESERWLLSRGYPIFNEQGKPQRYLGIIMDITDSKLAYARIEASEDLLQKALDSLPSHIAILDEAGMILTVNQRWREFARLGNWASSTCGIGESYLVACQNAACGAPGLPCRDRDAAEVLQQLEELLAGKIDFFEHEYNCPEPDGKERWFTMSAHRFLQGTRLRILVRHSDFTERRNLEATQRRLMRAIEATDNTVMIADKHANIIFVNPAFSKHTGYSPEEAIGRNPRFLHDKETASTDFTTMWKVLLAGRTWTGEFRNRRKDGAILWEAATISPILDAHGEIENFVAVKETVTEKRRVLDQLETYKSHLELLVAERTAQLESAQNRLQLILESTAEGIIETDKAGLITFVNKAACVMLGYDEIDLLGKSAHQSIHHHHADGLPHDILDCPIHACLKEGTPSSHDEDVFWRADQTALPVRYAVKQILLNGERTGAVIDFSDNSARKQVEVEREKAREASENLARIKSEFLANMSHEIRTPLNGVLGLAQIGFRDSYGRPEMQANFARILDSGKVLLTVINDILDFSKIESGKLAIERIPVDPVRVARDALDSIEERAAAKGLSLHCDIQPGIPVACLGDPVRISQILLNLLSNAIKFTSRGEVRIRIAANDGCLVYQVADTGIGMNEEQLARLFKPFEQANASTTRKYGGTGLGLVISKRLAELMDGSLTVYSQPDQGSCFELRLPCIAARLTPTESRAPTVGSHRLAGLRILVAEDNEINQFVLADLLKSEGAILTIVDNGKLAVDAIASNPGGYDLILMDVQMPELDGRAATRRISQIAPHVPVIGQTAHALVEERALCLEAGMIDTLTKPIDHEALVSTILSHIGGRDPDIGSPTGEIETAALPLEAAERPSCTIIDMEKLLLTNGGRRQFVEKLLLIALESNAAKAEAIRAARATGKFPDLRAVAHAIKGMAGHFCADTLVDAAYRLEVAAREEHADAFELADSLAVLMERFVAEIRTLCPTSGNVGIDT